MDQDSGDLVAYGWGPRVEAAWHAVAPDGPGAVAGRVVRAQYTHAQVVTDAGLLTVALAAADGGGRPAGDDGAAPAATTGDWVAVDVAADPPRVTAVVPRWSELVRMDALGRDRQVLAANVDVGLVVHGADRPLRPGRIERTAALVWDSGAVPAVVLNKADLLDDAEADDLRRQLEGLVPGADVVVVSARDGSGLTDLLAAVGDRTAVLLGESGGGKSMLVNLLADAAVAETGDVRGGDAKGRHTTTTRELFPLPGGGVVIDTPGIRAVGLVDADEGVAQVFADIVRLAERCRFGDCAHGTEPGCAVNAAVEAGVLDADRLARYLALQEEVDQVDRAAVERQRKQRGKAGAKLVRQYYRSHPDKRDPR